MYTISCLHAFQESSHTFEIKMPNLNPKNKLISFPLIQFSQPLIKAEIQPIKIHVTFLHKILFINIVVQNCRYTSENGPRLFGLYSNRLFTFVLFTFGLSPFGLPMTIGLFWTIRTL